MRGKGKRPGARTPEQRSHRQIDNDSPVHRGLTPPIRNPSPSTIASSPVPSRTPAQMLPFIAASAVGKGQRSFLSPQPHRMLTTSIIHAKSSAPVVTKVSVGIGSDRTVSRNFSEPEISQVLSATERTPLKAKSPFTAPAYAHNRVKIGPKHVYRNLQIPSVESSHPKRTSSLADSQRIEAARTRAGSVVPGKVKTSNKKQATESHRVNSLDLQNLSQALMSSLIKKRISSFSSKRSDLTREDQKDLEEFIFDTIAEISHGNSGSVDSDTLINKAPSPYRAANPGPLEMIMGEKSSHRRRKSKKNKKLSIQTSDNDEAPILLTDNMDSESEVVVPAVRRPKASADVQERYRYAMKKLISSPSATETTFSVTSGADDVERMSGFSPYPEFNIKDLWSAATEAYMARMANLSPRSRKQQKEKDVDCENEKKEEVTHVELDTGVEEEIAPTPDGDHASIPENNQETETVAYPTEKLQILLE